MQCFSFFLAGLYKLRIIDSEVGAFFPSDMQRINSACAKLKESFGNVAEVSCLSSLVASGYFD